MALRDIHRKPEHRPLAYFITVRTYGTWMLGDVRGSVSRRQNRFGTPRMEANAEMERSCDDRLRHDPVIFGAKAAALVEATVAEVCAHRRWHLWAVQMRTNHLHVVVAAEHSAERVLGDLKAWCTRRLREGEFVGRTEDAWARHGSTPHLWTAEALQGAIDYVLNRQGERLEG